MVSPTDAVDCHRILNTPMQLEFLAHGVDGKNLLSAGDDPAQQSLPHRAWFGLHSILFATVDCRFGNCSDVRLPFDAANRSCDLELVECAQAERQIRERVGLSPET